VKFYHILLLIGIFCLPFSNVKGQTIYYQDIYRGGVTGDGYNPFNIEATGTLDIYIESGSTIRNAFLFVTVVKYDTVIDNTILFDGNLLNLSWSDALNNGYNMDPSGAGIYEYRTIAIDVSQYMNPSQTTYTLTSPSGQIATGTNGVYGAFYLYVTYENALLPTVNASVIVNDQDAQPFLGYSLVNLNVIDTTNNVGFAFNSDSFCDTVAGIEDGSYISIEGTTIGLLGGNEDPVNEPMCTGVRGAFYYQNSLLFGLDNDTPDLFMSGVDALASIENYLTSPYSIQVQFDYQVPGDPGEKTNPVHQLFFSYETPCDTFSVSVPNDTTFCAGVQYQLNVSGGQNYQWWPELGLSCSDCPNPVFTGDSSMVYTVRIWNNDSCSVVRPVHIRVLPKPSVENVSVQASDCGTNNGSVTFNYANGTSTPVSYALQGGAFQTSNVFPSLATGNYNFILQDGNGCLSEDTLVFVPEVNNTIAAFTVSPDYGIAPLTIALTDASQNATDYLWSVNGISEGSTLESFTCDTSGTYTLQLIAWQFDPSCADTAYQTIIVIDQLIIATAFTPDDDGVNDLWELPNIDEIYPENIVSVYNRWGELLFQSESGTYSAYPWKGKYNDDPLPVGSYYFVIETHDQVEETFNGIVSIIR
jgi:gliding motility-associated-like protein